MKILIMGLPGSGKTYLAEKLKEQIDINKHTIYDEVCATKKERAEINPDITVWLDTVDDLQDFEVPEGHVHFKIIRDLSDSEILSLINQIQESIA